MRGVRGSGRAGAFGEGFVKRAAFEGGVVGAGVIGGDGGQVRSVLGLRLLRGCGWSYTWDESGREVGGSGCSRGRRLGKTRIDVFIVVSGVITAVVSGRSGGKLSR